MAPSSDWACASVRPARARGLEVEGGELLGGVQAGGGEAEQGGELGLLGGSRCSLFSMVGSPWMKESLTIAAVQHEAMIVAPSTKASPYCCDAAKLDGNPYSAGRRSGNVQAVAPGLLGRQHGVAGALHRAERVVLGASAAAPMLAVSATRRRSMLDLGGLDLRAQPLGHARRGGRSVSGITRQNSSP